MSNYWQTYRRILRQRTIHEAWYIAAILIILVVTILKGEGVL